MLAPATASLAQTQSEARQVSVPIRITWKEQPGVKRYRLQVARDEGFTDIVFDRIVTGTEYTVRDLPPSPYYWHIAPAAGETGVFSQPALVQPNANANASSNQTPVITSVANSNPAAVTASGNTGWRTATGNVTQPLAAYLRAPSSVDLVGVNSDGMVYALDGSNGVALWTARFRPKAKRGEPTGNGGAAPFNPVIFGARAGGLANVVVAFEGGVRALEGATGRQLWSASLPGRASSGAAADMDGDGAQEIVVLSDGTPTLVILNGNTGKLIAQSKLDAAATGAPALFSNAQMRGVVLALAGGIIEMRGANGERTLSIKLDAAITTPPIVVQSQGRSVVMVGTERGLIALDGADLKPLWRVATDEDAPRGTLASADMDTDGAQDVVMVTRRGRTVAVNSANGKIKWYANGATDAASAAFADLNGDGALDVMVAAGPAFALGFSGRDGSVIWKAEGEAGRAGTSDGSSARALVTAPVSSGAGAFLVGSDPARTGLRAVGLPKGAGKIVAR